MFMEPNGDQGGGNGGNPGGSEPGVLKMTQAEFNAKMAENRRNLQKENEALKTKAQAFDNLHGQVSELLGSGFQAIFQLDQIFFAAAEFGLQLGLCSLGWCSVTQHLVQVDVTDFELLRMCGQRAQYQAGCREGLGDEFHDQNAVPIWN